MPSGILTSVHEVDHIIARQHRGADTSSNLALACFYCNSNKGPNIASRDPLTRKLTTLFHPRRHSWHHHFRWNGGILVARTAIARVTIHILGINDEHRVLLRESLIIEGLFPPEDT